MKPIGRRVTRVQRKLMSMDKLAEMLAEHASGPGSGRGGGGFGPGAENSQPNEKIENIVGGPGDLRGRGPKSHIGGDKRERERNFSLLASLHGLTTLDHPDHPDQVRVSAGFRGSRTQTRTWTKPAGTWTKPTPARPLRWGAASSSAKSCVSATPETRRNPYLVDAQFALPRARRGRLRFSQWLAQQRSRRDPIGDLARDVALDRERPRRLTAKTLLRYLEDLGVGAEVIEAVRRAGVEYRHLSVAKMEES